MKFSLISDWLTDFLHHQFKQFSTRSGYAVGVSGMALFCLSLLSWKLLGAIALGLVVAWGVYENQQPHVQWGPRVRKSIRNIWNTALGKSAICGSSVTLALLSGFSLTNATGRGWIAATLILQSIMASGVWALWRQAQLNHNPKPSPSHPPSLDRYINDLAHPALMRRLIAVRRLHHGLLTHSISSTERHELHDYFQILLTQETDPVIRLALQDALENFYRNATRRAIRGSSLEDLKTVQVRTLSTDSSIPSLSALNL